jgi:hypothetical protein
MLSEVKQFYTAFENMSRASTPTESLLISIMIEKIQNTIDRLLKKLVYLQQEYQTKRMIRRKLKL